MAITQHPTARAKLPIVVAGLDTGSNRWHLVTSHGFAHSSGPWEYKRKADAEWENPDIRRLRLHRDLKLVLSILPVGSHVFCEEPLALQNGKTTRLLGLAAGALWATHLEFDMFWHWVDVSSWKKDVIGNGNATKEQIQEFLKERHGCEYSEEDYFDAHAICLYGASALEQEDIRVLRTDPTGS